jgi:hypothetical protein
MIIILNTLPRNKEKKHGLQGEISNSFQDVNNVIL